MAARARAAKPAGEVAFDFVLSEIRTTVRMFFGQLGGSWSRLGGRITIERVQEQLFALKLIFHGSIEGRAIHPRLRARVEELQREIVTAYAWAEHAANGVDRG